MPPGTTVEENKQLVSRFADEVINLQIARRNPMDSGYEGNPASWNRLLKWRSDLFCNRPGVLRIYH